MYVSLSVECQTHSRQAVAIIFMSCDSLIPVYFQQALSPVCSLLQMPLNHHFLVETATSAAVSWGWGLLPFGGKGEGLWVRQGCICHAGRQAMCFFVCFFHVFKLPYLQLQGSAKLNSISICHPFPGWVSQLLLLLKVIKKSGIAKELWRFQGLEMERPEYKRGEVIFFITK